MLEKQSDLTFVVGFWLIKFSVYETGIIIGNAFLLHTNCNIMSQYLINTCDYAYRQLTVKTMKPFTTNLALQDSLTSKKRMSNQNTEDLPKDIQHKLKLIEKAFK